MNSRDSMTHSGLISSRRRDLAWMLVLVLLLGSVWAVRGDVASAGGAPTPTGVDVVYVTVGTNFPDALGIGPGAALFGAPVILVPTDPPLPAVTADELVRLDPKRVVIVGGTSAVSTAMEDAINDLLPLTAIERLSGSNRYDTNSQFSESAFPYEAWVSVGPAAFTAADPNDVVLTDIVATVHGAGNATLYAPLVVPDGATILALRVIGVDTDADLGGAAAGDDVLVSIEQVFDSSIGGASCGANSSGAPGEFTTTCELVLPVIVDGVSYRIMVAGADGDPAIHLVAVKYRVGDPND